MKTTKEKILKKSMQQKKSRNGEVEKSLPIAKIRELNNDEWVAVHLTKVDRYDNPMAGVVVAHAKTDIELLRQAKEYRVKNPKAKVYIFFAGNVIPEGVVVVLEISQ